MKTNYTLVILAMAILVMIPISVSDLRYICDEGDENSDHPKCEEFLEEQAQATAEQRAEWEEAQQRQALTLPSAYAAGGDGNSGGVDAYKSGYDYGCYDSDFRYPADRYINQPGKGPSFHTEAFLFGYVNGFSDCNDNGYQSTIDFPELEEGQRWGTCEDKGGDIGLVCDIIEENKK